MKPYSRRIQPDVERELQLAAHAQLAGMAANAFAHLERAHILGQASTLHHVRVHCHMLHWGWRHRHWRECRGQVLRIIGAATKTALGWVPSGNTGGVNVSPFKAMPIAPDLAAKMDWARSRQD